MTDSKALNPKPQPKRRTLGPRSGLGIWDFFGYLGIWAFRISLGAWVLGSLGLSAPAAPAPTPRITLAAEFVQGTPCPVYRVGEAVELEVRVEGTRLRPEKLQWTVTDYRDQLVATGDKPVAAGSEPWVERMKVSTDVAGYFQVNLRLANSKVTLPRTGSRPAGFVAYGVLPPIHAAPLDHVDDSRFGAQGTCYIRSGEVMVGNYVDPVYPLLGAKWIYLNRRAGPLFRKGLDQHNLKLTAGDWQQQTMYEAAAGLCLFVDAFSVPAWLIDYPPGVEPKASPRLNQDLQAYPPKNWEAYGEIIGRIAAEQALRRKALFPNQRHNYYEIHWEPDWHWKGSDAGFIRMYEVAHAAIRRADPDGLLLGANYGVLKAGNERFRRLFAAGLGQHLDGIVTHAYYIPGPRAGVTPEDGMIAELRELRAMMRQYLPPGAPLIQTEWGLHYPKPLSEDPDGLRWEAAWFLRGHLVNLGEGADTTFFFYTADIGVSGGGGLLFNLTTPNPGAGATHVAPKPVFMATAAATRLLEGSTSLGALEYLADGSWGYAFQLGDERILALWSRDDRPRTIGVPTGTDRVTLFDPMGNTTELICERGVARVAIGAMPVYLRGVSPAVLPFASGAAGALALPAARFPGEPLAATRTPPGATVLKVFGDTGWTPLADRISPAQSPATILVGAFRASDPRDSQDEQQTQGLVVRALRDRTVRRRSRRTTTTEHHSVAGEGCMGDDTDAIPMAVAVVDIQPVAALSRSGDALGETAVTVANRTAQPLRGTLVVRHGDTALLDTPLLVPADEPARVNVATTHLPPGTTLQAVFTSAGGASIQAELPADGCRVTAERRATPPVIDGATTDWFLEDFTTYHTKTKRGKTESRVAIGYDDTALYMAVRTRDRSHYQQASPADSWQGDSIQVGLAMEDRFARGQWHKLCFARGGDRTIGYCHEGPKAAKGALAGDAVPHAVVRDGNETVYEFAFSWQRLGASAPPDQLRIGLLVNDVDLEKGQPTRRSTADVFGGMSWSQPEDFGVLSLESTTND